MCIRNSLTSCIQLATLVRCLPSFKLKSSLPGWTPKSWYLNLETIYD